MLHCIRDAILKVHSHKTNISVRLYQNVYGAYKFVYNGKLTTLHCFQTSSGTLFLNLADNFPKVRMESAQLFLAPSPVRSGLNINWSAFGTYLRNGLVYGMNEQKTGNNYNVAIKMESDQVMLMDELMQR